MTGYESKRAAAQDKLAQPAQESTLQEKDRKRGSIALARSLCYKINGAADDSDDMDGGGYGSVDIAEILSAEVVRLQAALAQPAQEPQRPWVDLTRTQIQNVYFAVLEEHRGGHQMQGQLAFGEALQAAIKDKNK